MKYLEVKVVKVKKKEKDFKCEPRRYCGECWIYKHCPIYKGTRKEKSKPKGNWVNNENLDKIKFPCFCSFEVGSVKRYGMITTNFFGGNDEYTLHNIDRQQVIGYAVSAWFRSKYLEKLIKHNNIHILKGKIILFDDTLENGKYDIDIEEE